MQGITLVISGPAGVGKTTLCDRLILNFKPVLSRVVTVTTRNPRKGEVNNVDYIFKSILEFEDLKNNNEFLEYAEVHNNFYGSLKSSVLKLLESKHDALLNIDVQGASSFKKLESKSNLLKNQIISVFVMPKNLNDLRTRLNLRGKDSEQEIEKRLKTAKNEMTLHDQFDYLIHSETKDADYNELMNIYRKHSKLLEL